MQGPHWPVDSAASQPVHAFGLGERAAPGREGQQQPDAEVGAELVQAGPGQRSRGGVGPGQPAAAVPADEQRRQRRRGSAGEVQDLGEGCARRRLDDARAVDRAAQGEQHRAGLVRRADRTEPAGAVARDQGDMGEGLGVGQHCRAARRHRARRCGAARPWEGPARPTGAGRWPMPPRRRIGPAPRRCGPQARAAPGAGAPPSRRSAR